MIYIITILTAMVSYLIGSVSGSIILSKKISGRDIRLEGSKNAGTTNMLRIHGKKAAAGTLLIDVFKGVLATIIGVLVDISIEEYAPYLREEFLYNSMKYVSAIFVVLGHDYPIYFGFRGGKGVATSLGVIMVLDWKIGLIVLGAALFIMLITRYVSLGSIMAAVIYVCSVLAFMTAKVRFNVTYIISSVFLAFLIIIKHRENIVRLKNGNENKLSFKTKTEEQGE